MNKLAWLGCLVAVMACGKKKEGADKPVEPGPAAAAAGGAGPCVGKWTLSLDAWGKGDCETDEWVVDRTFYVVRGKDNAYRALNPEGIQDLDTKVTSDEATGCSIVVNQTYVERFGSQELQYSLESRGGARATGLFTETSYNPGDEDDTEGEDTCTREFSLKAALAPLAAADLAFDPARAKREFDEVLQGDEAPLTLKEFCELPAMQGTLPRKAQVKIGVDDRGRVASLAIDGADQGNLDSICMFPSSLEEAMGPPSVTNLTGAPQTATFELELR